MAKGDPIAVYKRALDALHGLEEAAFRYALEQHNGFEAAAAELLGWPRSTLKNALMRRHKALHAEAAKMRKAAGYTGGAVHQLSRGK